MQANEYKKNIMKGLHDLISNNVIGDKQYDSRYKGFRGELSYFERCRTVGQRLYSGGYLVPRETGASATSNPVYFTITSDAPEEAYRRIFSRISNLDCVALYFVQYERNVEVLNMEKADIMGIGVKLPVPKLTVSAFDVKNAAFTPATISDLVGHFEPTGQIRGRRYPIDSAIIKAHIDRLREYPIEDLEALYVQRLVFDGMIGLGRVRGIPSDIDGILCDGDEPQCLVEIKEKDLSKREPRGFGMDVGRMQSLLHISDRTGIPYHYIVRQVEDQIARNFVQWLSIEMKEFEKGVLGQKFIEGGTGMRSQSSSNPTLVCPLERFTPLP